MSSDFEALLASLRALANAVVTRAPSEAAVVRKGPRWTFERRGDGAIVSGQTYEDRIYWSHTDVHAWLASLAGYTQAAELLGREAGVQAWIKERNSGGDPSSAREAGLNRLIRDLVLGVLEIGAWSVSEPRWERMVSRLRGLLDGEATYHVLAFLYGIGVSDAITLGSLVLRPPTRYELLEAFNRHWGMEANWPIASCDAVVEGFQRIPIGDRATLLGMSGSVVAALRIWTRQPIVAIATYEGEDRDALLGSVRPTAKHLPIHSKSVPLEDPTGFARFFERARAILLKPPEALGVALRRLDTSVEQERASDRMLDMYIILEALLLDEKQELAYRLALRTAHFVGTDKSARAVVRDTIKKGYGLRSKIAHGAPLSTSDETLVAQVDDIVMRALRRYCERAGEQAGRDPHKAIIAELEELMLEGRDS